jgi:hypothetical protein
MPPNPWKDQTLRRPLGPALEAKLRECCANRSAFDAAVGSIGTHYYAGYNSGVPAANVTRAYAEDVAGLTAYLASHGTRSLAFFTGLRPVIERKPPRWRSQTECVAADINAAAIAILRQPPEEVSTRPPLRITVLDGFEWSRGLGAKHSTDGTHYDVPVLVAQAQVLLESVAGSLASPSWRSQPQQWQRGGSSGGAAASGNELSNERQRGGPHHGARRPCQLQVRWYRDSEELQQRHGTLLRALPVGYGVRVFASRSSTQRALVHAVERFGIEDANISAALCRQPEERGGRKMATLPACSFGVSISLFGSNPTNTSMAFILYQCSDGCPVDCGVGGGDCGRGLRMRVLRPQKTPRGTLQGPGVLQLTCPEFGGSECQLPGVDRGV